MDLAISWAAGAGWIAGGAGSLGLGLWALWRRRPRTRGSQGRLDPVRIAARPEPTDTASLVELMLAQSRASLLLRPQVFNNLNEAQRQRAADALRESMALLPQGEIRLGWSGKAGYEEEEDEDAVPVIVDVERSLMDRCAVTNAQYFEFVAAGGYDQASLWESEAWYSIGKFVDQTDCLAPRYWRNAQYPTGEADKPVVGVSWFEAMAYARWAGKRLPHDAEWEKAGCWPIGGRQQRFPWGDSMDPAKANVWGSGLNGVVAVNQFPTGASPGGMLQLVGNVWEWTQDECGLPPYGREGVKLALPMKSIRGGAFDSYFDSQAICQFQSGEVAAQRKHNIGFRCIVSTNDLAVDPFASNHPGASGGNRPQNKRIAQPGPRDEPYSVSQPATAP